MIHAEVQITRKEKTGMTNESVPIPAINPKTKKAYKDGRTVLKDMEVPVYGDVTVSDVKAFHRDDMKRMRKQIRRGKPATHEGARVNFSRIIGLDATAKSVHDYRESVKPKPVISKNVIERDKGVEDPLMPANKGVSGKSLKPARPPKNFRR